MILASRSPQRVGLLRDGGVVPRVVPADVDETPRAGETPVALVRRLAGAKASAVTGAVPGAVVLGADTVVVSAGTMLGKPSDDRAARAMLRALAGRDLEAVTGVAVAVGPGSAEVAHLSTSLRLRPLDDGEIDAYVATGEPRGAAGAFRIQARGAALVAALRGCRSNVAGLPTCLVARLLAPHGVSLASDEAEHAR